MKNKNTDEKKILERFRQYFKNMGLEETYWEIVEYEEENFCCWNEEEDKAYEIETLGNDYYRCLGCLNKYKSTGEENG